MERKTDLSALGLDECISHSAADDKVVNLSYEVLENGEFRGNLGSTDNGGKRPLGVLEDIVDSLDLAFHQVSEHLVVREIVSDEGGRSMGAVSGTEGVVDIAVSIAGELLDELFLAGLYHSLGCLFLFLGCILGETSGFSFLLCIEAEVLEKESLTRLKGSSLSVCLLAVLSKLYGNSEALRNMVYDMFKREFGIDFLGTSEMGHDDKRTTLLKNLLEGRHGPTDTSVVRNLKIFV